MTAGFNAVPVDVNNVPIAEVYPPGSTGNIVALQGSATTTTDAKGNVSSPANFNLTQVNSVAVQADGGSSNIPGVSLYGKHSAAGDTPLFLDATGRPLVSLAQINGVTPQMDGGSTNRLGVSLYGKKSAAGDTPLLLDSSGRSQINLQQIGGVNSQMSGSDGVTAANVLLVGHAISNGTTMDQQRGNLDNIVMLASAARTTTQTQADQTNYNHRGIIVVLDMTVVGTGSVTLEIDGKDPVSGKYYVILTGVAVITNVTNIYRVYPGLTAATNATANDVLPRTWRVKVTANNSNTATYSVGCMLIL